MQEPKPGTRFAERFELRQVVVQTPAYVEYRAVDSEIGVEVGLWWVRPGMVPDSARQEQWMGAGVELRRFSHPNVRKLHGAGQANGTVWASWQLAAGAGPAPMRGDPVELPSLVRWIDAACGALAALHRVGIVHGRLLAEDVVVVAGELKLGGAGMLRLLEPRAALGAWQRRLGFVAPEVRAGAAPTAATDAWSVAAIAAAMVAGADGADEAIRVVAKRHPPLHDLLGGVLTAPPEARPGDLAAFAKEARERAKMPYLADDRTGPMRALRAGALAAAAPPPAGKPFKAGGRPKPETAKLGSGASAPELAAPDDPTKIDPSKQEKHEPQTFALPTPPAAPPAPIPKAPAVSIGPAGYPTPPPEPPPPAAALAPAPTPEPSARLPRARTAPPAGGFQVVSMKPADPRPPTAPPDAEAAGKPASARIKKPKLRSIADAQQRSFSTKAGALGYLAPPKEVAEQYKRAARRRTIMTIVVAILLVGAAVGGYLIATHA
jgi:hypothetical protein